jgi:hypothetical protein
MKQISKPVPNSTSLNRRQFLTRTGLVLGAAGLTFPYVGNVLGANDRIAVACIGVGGKGDSDSKDAARCGGTIVALCDADKNTLARKAKQFPEAKQYHDYRKLLDEMGKDIDAVTVSTPDHNHGIASIRAMKMGKHCFCQKPLVQTVNEARLMRQLAKDKNLATQMGNQGSAERPAPCLEVIQAGIIGNPTEVTSGQSSLAARLSRPAPDPIPPELTGNPDRLRRRPFKKDSTHVQVAQLISAPAPGRHGLPHRQYAVPCAQSRLPKRRRVRNGLPHVPGNLP